MMDTVALFGEMHWQFSPLMSDLFEAVSPLKMTYCLFGRHTIDEYIFYFLYSEDPQLHQDFEPLAFSSSNSIEKIKLTN